jgi:hypothetical protein
MFKRVLLLLLLVAVLVITPGAAGMYCYRNISIGGWRH